MFHRVFSCQKGIIFDDNHVRRAFRILTRKPSERMKDRERTRGSTPATAFPLTTHESPSPASSRVNSPHYDQPTVCIHECPKTAHAIPFSPLKIIFLNKFLKIANLFILSSHFITFVFEIYADPFERCWSTRAWPPLPPPMPLAWEIGNSMLLATRSTNDVFL